MNFEGLFDSSPKSFPKTLGPFISKRGKALLQIYKILASVTSTLLRTVTDTETQMSSLSKKTHSFHLSIRQSSFINLSNTLPHHHHFYYIRGTVLVPGYETMNKTSAPLLRGLSRWWLSSEELACSAGDTGDMGLIFGSGRSPGEGHGNPLHALHYSSLESPMDRGAWWATVQGVTKS